MEYLHCTKCMVVYKFQFLYIIKPYPSKWNTIESPKRNYIHVNEWSHVTWQYTPAKHPMRLDIKSQRYSASDLFVMQLLLRYFSFLLSISPPKYTRYTKKMSPDPPIQGNRIYTKWEEFYCLVLDTYLHGLRIIAAWQGCWATWNAFIWAYFQILGNEHTPVAPSLPHVLDQSCICRNWYQRKQESKRLWVRLTRIMRTK